MITLVEALGLLALVAAACVYVGGVAASLTALGAQLRAVPRLRARQLLAVLFHVVLAVLWPAVWGWDRAERLLDR